MCPHCGKSTQLPGTVVNCRRHVGVYDNAGPAGMLCGHSLYEGGKCGMLYQHRGHCRPNSPLVRALRAPRRFLQKVLP